MPINDIPLTSGTASIGIVTIANLETMKAMMYSFRLRTNAAT